MLYTSERTERMLLRHITNHHHIIYPNPLPQGLLACIPDHNMKMLQRRHALQRSPILKPQHTLLRRIHMSLPRQTLHESSRHKRLDARARLGGQIPIILHRQRGLQPDDQMPDARCDSVRPVVEADAIVRGACKGGGILEDDFGVLLVPAETLLADVGEDAAVQLFYAF